jgi:FixJ family two-component response regulator
MITARFEGVAVVLMTGFADVSSDEIAEMCIEVLQKPTSAPELANVLHRALHGTGNGAP